MSESYTAQAKNALALAGKTAGVQVVSNSGQPGSDVQIYIRGIGTNGTATPIYIVDGMAVSGIEYLNPGDIESIEVLKDAAASAIYGTRGGNGVVLITTRRSKDGQWSVNYDFSYGIQNIARKIDVLNAREYAIIQNEAAANSGATVTVKISGTGNLTFVQAPKLPLPTSFEQYNVKTTESINTSASGISGYRQFEYPFIARAEGAYDIEPIEFTYFDPQRVQYVTLKSKPLTLEITPDARGGGDAVVMQGRGMSKEEVKMLGQDIRFIKLGGAQLRSERVPFIFSAAYWILLLGVLALFTMIYVALRKQIRESQNVALVRGKRANKVAVQRFRAAKRYMEEQNRHAFYEEMLRALWGYMSDKFNIPVANLTKENVREELHKRGVSSEDSQRFTDIITRCDEAQYSPVESARMNDVYSEGVNLISRIESVIKR